jgi:hypothetical protein
MAGRNTSADRRLRVSHSGGAGKSRKSDCCLVVLNKSTITTILQDEPEHQGWVGGQKLTARTSRPRSELPTFGQPCTLGSPQNSTQRFVCRLARRKCVSDLWIQADDIRFLCYFRSVLTDIPKVTQRCSPSE